MFSVIDLMYIKEINVKSFDSEHKKRPAVTQAFDTYNFTFKSFN